MDDAVSTMIEWFLELSQQDHEGANPDRPDWRAWWDSIEDLSLADWTRLSFTTEFATTGFGA